jgi:hypothetical protein
LSGRNGVDGFLASFSGVSPGLEGIYRVKQADVRFKPLQER